MPTSHSHKVIILPKPSVTQTFLLLIQRLRPNLFLAS